MPFSGASLTHNRNSRRELLSSKRQRRSGVYSSSVSFPAR